MNQKLTKKQEKQEIKKYEEYYTKLYSRITGIALVCFSIVKILILRSYWDNFGEDAIYDLGLWSFMALIGLTLIFPVLQKEYYFSKADKKRRQTFWSKSSKLNSMKLIYWYIGLSVFLIIYTFMSWDTIEGNPYDLIIEGFVYFILGLFTLWSHLPEGKKINEKLK